MPRDAQPTTKAIMAAIKLQGYRVGIGEHEGTWICTAKRDSDGQLHTSKAATEHQAICELAVSVGVDPATVGVEVGTSVPVEVATGS